MKDNLFQQADEGGAIYKGFEFDSSVVEVFDDMVNRSIPWYHDIQLLLAKVAVRIAGSAPICDLGCSTGNTLLAAIREASQPLTLIGLDSSEAMVQKCRAKLNEFGDLHRIIIQSGDVRDVKEFPCGKPKVFILSLVLQFLRPLDRPQVIQHLYEQLENGGCLLLVEKTVQSNRVLNEIYLEFYHDFKKTMGYSEMEIAKKRQALENRLIPFMPEENLRLLTEGGFRTVSTIFSWLNFQAYIAMKDDSPRTR